MDAKMKKKTKLAFCTTALASALAISGCIGPENSSIYFPSAYNYVTRAENPRIAIATVNGFLSSKPGDFIYEIAKEHGILSQDAPVGSYRKLLPFLEEANKNGNELWCVGYSSGADQITHAAKKLAKRNIPIKKMFLIDPTKGLALASSSDIPGNVKEIYVYFSNGSGFMSWARGIEENFTPVKDSRIKLVKHLNGTHTSCLTADQTFRNDLERLIESESSLAFGPQLE